MDPHDELIRLKTENEALKRSNLDKSETVKKLGVHLTRIRNDWQTQAAPKDMAPVAKARAAAEASKSDRISELQVELSQRDAKVQQLQRQLTLLKQQVGSTGGAKGGVTRQRRVTPRPVTASGISPPARIRNKSPGRVAEDAPGDGGRMSSLLAMVSEKDRALDELRAKMLASSFSPEELLRILPRCDTRCVCNGCARPTRAPRSSCISCSAIASLQP